MDHSEALFEILDTDTILFGEWLYTKHSISYNNLPDYFLAFDLFSKKKKLFYHRNILLDKLKDTSIIPVRSIYEGKIRDRDQLLTMINATSQYTDTRVEGIYLKMYQGDYVESRCKLVRNDFLEGNQHWSKRKVEKNKLSIMRYK
jgi:atypical dual specificity phosphatase